MKCPNYFGASYKDFKSYYSGVLHSRKPRFLDDSKKESRPGEVIIDDGRERPVQNNKGMDKADWELVYLLVILSGLLTVFGGFLI